MKYLLMLFLIIPGLSLADVVECNYGMRAVEGKFNGVEQNGNGMLFTFTTEDGQKIIASFNACRVILDKPQEKK